MCPAPSPTGRRRLRASPFAPVSTSTEPRRCSCSPPRVRRPGHPRRRHAVEQIARRKIAPGGRRRGAGAHLLHPHRRRAAGRPSAAPGASRGPAQSLAGSAEARYYHASGRVELVAQISLQDLLKPWTRWRNPTPEGDEERRAFTGSSSMRAARRLRPAYAPRLIGEDGRGALRLRWTRGPGLTRYAAPVLFVPIPRTPRPCGPEAPRSSSGRAARRHRHRAMLRQSRPRASLRRPSIRGEASGRRGHHESWWPIPESPPRLEPPVAGALDYPWAHRLQRLRRQSVIEGTAPEALWLMEHGPVVTLGRRRGADDDAPRPTPCAPSEAGWPPGTVLGQLVGYLIVDIGARGLGGPPHWCCAVEEGTHRLAGQRAFAAAPAGRASVDAHHHHHQRVGRRQDRALGLHVRRGVTLHGFALNLRNSLAPSSASCPAAS